MSTITKESRSKKWEALIENYEKSDLSQKAFCDQNDLVLHQFIYYRGKIKSIEKKSSLTSPLFSPIQLQKNGSNDSREIRITLPNGFQCVFPGDMDAFVLKKYMEMLLSC